MIVGRNLSRDDIRRVWEIDRREIVHRVYRLENGSLALRPQFFDVRGWPPGEREKYTPILEACFDHGGWLFGSFDAARIVAVAVLDARFIGKRADELQLTFLHVSQAYRGQGLGRQLFGAAAGEALRRGATALYISATPSEHTIDFYLRLGCTVAPEPDPELFELEPEDIHLEYVLRGEGATGWRRSR